MRWNGREIYPAAVFSWLFVILTWGIMFALALRGGCGCVQVAEGQTTAMPGDTVRVVFVARDSLGSAVLPESARLFVMRDGIVVDSSRAYPGSGLTQVPSSGSKNYALQGTYIVSGAGTYPIDLQFLARYTWEGFVDDQAECSPRVVRVNPRVKTVDTVTSVDHIAVVDSVGVLGEEILADVGLINSLGDSALAQIQEAVISPQASEWVAPVDSTACDGCGVYYGGDPVTGALVYATADSVTPSGVSAVGTTDFSVAGNFRVWVPLIPGEPDTFWLHFYYRGRATDTPKRFIIEED